MNDIQVISEKLKKINSQLEDIIQMYRWITILMIFIILELLTIYIIAIVAYEVII